jgi:hypothetical protein
MFRFYIKQIAPVVRTELRHLNQTFPHSCLASQFCHERSLNCSRENGVVEAADVSSI